MQALINISPDPSETCVQRWDEDRAQTIRHCCSHLISTLLVCLKKSELQNYLKEEIHHHI